MTTERSDFLAVMGALRPYGTRQQEAARSTRSTARFRRRIIYETNYPTYSGRSALGVVQCDIMTAQRARALTEWRNAVQHIVDCR
jgi:hypothetical protein